MMKKTIKIISISGLIGMIAVMGISYYTVSRFISRRVYSDVQQAKLIHYKKNLIDEYGGQEIQLKTDDGLQLAGLVFIRPQASCTLLICHGWWMTKENLRYFVWNFPQENILIFDFRAHGESQGNLTSIGYFEKYDVKAAVEYIKQNPHLNKLPLIGLGISMGAAALLSAATELSLDGLILDSVFGSLDQTIKDAFALRTGLPEYPFFTVCQKLYAFACNCSMNEVSPLRWALNVNSPTLMIHSVQDQLASFSITKKLFENLASSSKRFWVVEQGQHAVLFKQYNKKYIQEVQAFLNEICQKTSLDDSTKKLS